MQVQLPNLKTRRYYRMHITYIMNLLKNGGADVHETDTVSTLVNDTKFEATINGHPVLFDFADHGDRSLAIDITNNYKAVFKMHYHPDYHRELRNFYPFSPISWYDWNLYQQLQSTVIYNAEGPILNKQRPYGDAILRRKNVQQMLKVKYGTQVDITQSPHELFLRMVSNNLVSVCVPGANNNMLDIGQGQYMSLGGCTISPILRSHGSWNLLPQPGVHYVLCKDDYSDLIERIEWVRENKTQAINIGNQAKQQFAEHCTPAKQVRWINQCIST